MHLLSFPSYSELSHNYSYFNYDDGAVAERDK